MTDIAELGFTIHFGGIDGAKRSLDLLTVSAAGAEKAVTGVAQGALRTEAGLNR